MCAVRNMEQFTYSKCKVASLLWFAHLCMRIYEDAQLLSRFHLVEHTSIPLIFQEKLMGQRSSFKG